MVSTNYLGLIERCVLAVVLLPTCHLIWEMFILVENHLNGQRLPRLHKIILEWVIHPKILLIISILFLISTFLCLSNQVCQTKLNHLKVSMTVVSVIVLGVTLLAQAAIIFPI